MKRLTTPSSSVLLILLVFSVFFTFFSGPISYYGDSWNFVYSKLFHEDFFNPAHYKNYWLYHRPVQYVLEIYLLRNFWIHPSATHFILFLFLSLSVFLFGKVLETIYPDEPQFIILTLLLLFFYAPFFESTFIMHFSIIFLTGAFFWCVCLFLFKLAQVQSFPSLFLYGFLAFVFYILSVFGYENFSFVVLALPMLVFFGKFWSPGLTYTKKIIHVLLRVALPAVGMFATVVLIKFWIAPYIGYFQSRITFQPFAFLRNIWAYWIRSLLYEVETFTEVTGSNYRYVALLIFVGFFLLFRKRTSVLRGNDYSPFIIGGSIFFLGVFPLAIIGKITGYSSCAIEFGVVLMFSGLFLLNRNPTFHGIVKFLLLLLLSCNMAFTFKLAEQKKKTAQFQKAIFMSLLEVCPDVKDGTSLIFLGEQRFLDGEHVIHFLPQIIYNNQTLYGGFAYSEKMAHVFGRTLIITPDRLKPVSQRSNFAPLIEDVIILKYHDSGRFEIVDIRKTDPLNAIWAESYFELTKNALYGMMNEGLPEEIKEHLKPLKHRAFFKDEFLEAVEEHIGKEETEKYQELILKHAWRWTETYFEFTEQDLQNLSNKGVPENIFPYLERLEHRAFVRDQEFLDAIADRIGKEQTAEYRELLLQHARKKIDSITEVHSNTHLIKQKRVENAFTKYLASLPD